MPFAVRRACLILVFALTLPAVALPAAALAAAEPQPVDYPPPPEGSAVLTVTGTDGEATRFTLRELEALGMHESTTSTYWPGDEGPFAGPLLEDVLAAGGLAGAKAIRLTALDGYTVVIPRRDWRRWPLLLVTRVAGELLTVSEKGPLRILYPKDMDPELSERGYGLRSAWMLESIAPADPSEVR